MPDGLYERDALLWSEQQAGLLRRLAAGERVNDAMDWPNLIEEIEAMGRSELRACESLLRQALLHVLKLALWPGSRAVGHWRGEVMAALDDAQRAFTPSMRQRIDLDSLYAGALRRARVLSDESGPPGAVAEACPLSLDDLLADPYEVGVLMAAVSRHS